MTFTGASLWILECRRGARLGLARLRRAGFKPHLADLHALRQSIRADTRLRISRMPHASPWWAPPVHADRRPLLLARNRIKAAIRGLFEERGFVEVEAAALQVSPGNEAHLHAFATELIGDRRRARGRSISTPRRSSPARSCWRPASGASSISPGCSATASAGALHHPEFTLLEWYRAEEPYEVLMQDCAELLALAAETAGVPDAALPRPRGRPLRRAGAGDRGGGVRALRRHRPPRHARRRRRARPRDARRRRRRGRHARGRGRHLVGRLQPRARRAHRAEARARARRRSCSEYPVTEAALARPTARDPRVAERFELYACGVELANGFGELTDPAEQRRRFEAEMDEKQRVYGERYPIDEDFLAALAQMPQASGIALGFDRLVMLCVGAARIDEVALDARGGISPMKTLRTPAELIGARLVAPDRRSRARRGRGPLCGRHHAGDGGADRSGGPRRPDRAPVHPRRGASSSAGRTKTPTRSATRRTVPSRASCTAIRTACC